MTRLGIACLIGLLLLAPATAGPGHQGPTPVEERMYIHFTEAGMLLNPAQPGTASLSEAPAAPPVCASALSWQAVFTTDPAVAGSSPLVREADFDLSLIHI